MPKYKLEFHLEFPLGNQGERVDLTEGSEFVNVRYAAELSIKYKEATWHLRKRARNTNDNNYF